VSKPVLLPTLYPVTCFVLSIAAGIGLYAGITHLIIGLSRRPCDWTHVTFALMSISLAGHTLSVLLIHTAGSIPAYVAAFKWGFGPLVLLMMVALIWFVAFYTGVKPHRFLLGMSLWFTVIIVLHISLPNGILFAEVSGLRTITLPWGEQVVVAQATPHPWRPVVDLFLLTMYGFFFYAVVRQYRNGEHGRALLLGLAILVMLAANGFDTLVDTGVINSIYINQFAFLGIVIVMSLVLSRDITRTETELQRHQGHLEVLVDERTAELKYANEQLERANEELAREIVVREEAEAALRRRIEELSVLNRVAQMLTTTTDLPAALSQVSETVTHIFGARYVHILLPAVEESELMILVGAEREAGPIGTTPLDVSLEEMPHTRQVLSQAESLVLSDVPALPLAAPLRDFLTARNISSIMLVPLVVGGKAIGIMSLATDQGGRTFA
jgi:hypothetical protein